MVVKLIARILGLWAPHGLPRPFHGRIHGTDYDVRPMPCGEVSISISLPCASMRLLPQSFRKAEGPCIGAGVETYVNPLFDMGAQSVDIGLSGHTIKAIFPGEIVRVDRTFSAQVVVLMLRLRDEVTGQEKIRDVEP